jgi:hypothetical protein
MSLNNAILQFEQNKTPETLTKMVEVATEYWRDAMIADDTYAIYLSNAARWLREND